MKKHPQIFTQGTSVQNFSQIRPFLKSPGCPKVLASFWRKTRPQAPKIKILKKWKNTPRYLPKEQVCKISAKSDHFWSLQAAPKYFGTNTQTHRHAAIPDSSSTEVENNLLSLEKFMIIFTRKQTTNNEIET